jgi:hypothetical protein
MMSAIKTSLLEIIYQDDGRVDRIAMLSTPPRLGGLPTPPFWHARLQSSAPWRRGQTCSNVVAAPSRGIDRQGALSFTFATRRWRTTRSMVMKMRSIKSRLPLSRIILLFAKRHCSGTLRPYAVSRHGLLCRKAQAARGAQSQVCHQTHEAFVLVILMVAVNQCGTGIVGHEVNFDGAETEHIDRVFHHARG